MDGPRQNLGRSGILVFFASVAFALISTAASPGTAHAQRGARFVEQEPPAEGPLRGFPGAFDTNMVERGGVVADLPFMQLDYGATENLSLGVNLLPALPALRGQAPGAMGRLRYRLFASGRVSAAATFQGGYAGLAAEDMRAWGGYASTAVGFDLSAAHSISLTALAATFSLVDDERHEHYRVKAGGIALDYRTFASERLGLNATALALPFLSGGVESPSEISTLSANLRSVRSRVFVRALGMVKLGESWLVNAGGAVSLTLGQATPWLSVTKKW